MVPFPPGGSTDAIARIMADRMRAPLGQPVVIENVGGAGGSIAVGRVARAQPDGYTIDIGQWDTHVGSIIYKLNYDLQKDFDPIGLLSVNPQLMLAKKNLPANNLKELVAWMKANPGKITFVNQNAAAQVTGILFEQATGQKVQFIPYRGAGPAMTDLISGQVDLLVVQAAVTMPQLRGRNGQGARQSVAAALGRDPEHPDLGRERRAGPLYVGLVRLLRPARIAEGRARAAQRRDGARRWPIRRCASASPISASTSPRKEQQTPQGLAAFQDGRDQEMVADHQGGQYQGRMTEERGRCA